MSELNHYLCSGSCICNLNRMLSCFHHSFSIYCVMFQEAAILGLFPPGGVSILSNMYTFLTCFSDLRPLSL